MLISLQMTKITDYFPQYLYDDYNSFEKRLLKKMICHGSSYSENWI